MNRIIFGHHQSSRQYSQPTTFHSINHPVHMSSIPWDIIEPYLVRARLYTVPDPSTPTARLTRRRASARAHMQRMAAGTYLCIPLTSRSSIILPSVIDIAAYS